MDNFIRHIETFLGKIRHGWSTSADGVPMPFQVAACTGGTIDDVTAYLTLGLSHTGLASPVSAKMIRQELLMTLPTKAEGVGIPSLLQQLGSEALKSGTAYLRG